MKVNFILLVFGFVVNTVLVNFAKPIETLQEPDIIGTWYLCVSHVNGLNQYPNHCPEVTFYKNGSGVFFASEPSSSFHWKILNDKIVFSFDTTRDKKLFMGTSEEYHYELTKGNKGEELFKLISAVPDVWYRLSRKKKA